MAHWNIIDRNGNPVSIDVVYGQQNIDRVADTLYIKVIHSQGVSEALAHAENMTSPTVWSMDEVTVNALMAFNWTSNSMRNHTIAIDWKANAPSTFNSITWQNGTTSVVEGEWRNGATATIIIDGSGPHPSNYTSSWALVGRTADPPVMGGWTGRGAMAHWNIIDGHSNNTISIDAAYEQKSTDGKNATDILDITVTHPQGVSHTIARDINVTRWSFDRVQINATMPFEWTDGDRNHTIVIEWNTSPPTTSNRLTYPNGTAVYRPGDWRSGSGNMANATIAIDSGKGPHPGNYTSDWAAVGQTPQFSIPKQWFGYAAMAHWDFVTEDGVPITIDAICTQYTADGKANLTYVKVIHPAGVSTAIGYAANVTYNSEFYDTYYSVNLAQLAFNWTSGGNQVFRNHNITLVWDSYTEAYSEGITWQNGTTSFLPGEWRSADKLTSATIIIDGTGLHPGTYKSDWAAIGHTEQFDREQAFSMTGNMAMAHWDVADNKGNTVGIDAIYGQRLNNGSTAANALYIRVFHPQGISESTGTFVNMTTIPVWGMNHVRVEATLSFNWTDGYRPHPIVIDWTTTGTPTQNKITWQDGEFSCLPGAWISGIGNTAKANMTIGGSGPHPSTYTSNWAAVGETLTFPAQTWLGQGAMAHWDINPIESDDVISIDAAYGQQPGGGKADMIWVRVVHPQGVSQVTGYAINYTSGPTWSANHVFLNTTLALNWTTKTGEKNMTHTIAIDWKSTGLTKADAITWQNGSITTVLGDWKSDVGTTATIVIDGMEDHNHQGNYTSKWAVIGIAETAPTPTPTPSPTTSPTNTPTQSPTTKPTPAPTETPSSNTITAATDSGSNITISIGGNITASQISNAAITTDSSTGTTTLSFNVTGTTGTVGFGNITVPKSSVPLGSTPSLLIDGVPAEEQGYTEDATNFYVWYIVHFSSHEVSVVFTAPQPSPTPAPPIGVETIVAAAAVIVIVAVLAVFVVLRNKKSAKKK